MAYLFFPLAIVAIIVLIMLMGLINERRREKIFKNTLATDYGVLAERAYTSEQMKNIARYCIAHPIKPCQDWAGSSLGSNMEYGHDHGIDDITWHDLDMDEIFKRMNHCHSSAGEEYLYYLLRSPSMEAATLQKRETHISFFMSHPSERIAWQMIFARIGRSGKYSICDHLNFLGQIKKRSNGPHYAAILGFIFAATLTALIPGLGIFALIISLVCNLVSYFSLKKDVEAYITCFAYIYRVLGVLKTVEKNRLAILDDLIDEMLGYQADFKKFKRGSYLLLSPARLAGGNPLDIILDYLRMIFHLDLLKFNQMLAEIKKHEDKILRIVSIMGYIEAMIAVGAWRRSLQISHDAMQDDVVGLSGKPQDESETDKKDGGLAFCTPQFHADKHISAEGLYHPLLAAPVKNDLSIKHSLLISGCNASGKSTFLKSVAINAILAQSVHTCTATHYRTHFLRVASSMSLKDDILAGDSYYMVEIKAMKRLLDLCNEGGGPVLVLVDEVLRGTNTVERIAASTQILKSLNGAGSLCLAATHDMELTQILAHVYENCHFAEEIRDGDVHFSYKLLPGPATSRNALRLLRVMGYDEGLVAAAERMAEEGVNAERSVIHCKRTGLPC